MRHQLALLTRDEVRVLAPRSVAVLTVSAIEQHGPHLPLLTDFSIGNSIAEEACRLLEGDVSALLCPTLAYGSSHHHFPYPTLSLSSETMIMVIKDLVRSLDKCGFRQVFILNAHGGNDEVIRIAARDLASELGVSIAAASYWTIAQRQIDMLVSKREWAVARVPGHAGDFETSLMLRLEPDLVRLELRPLCRNDPVPALRKSGVFVQYSGDSVGLDGVSDNSQNADQDLGREAFDVIAQAVAETVRDFSRSCPVGEGPQEPADSQDSTD